MNKRITNALSFFVLLTALALGQAKAAEDLPPDVRVLIDVSGSMKQNDPLNLRVPALRLITNLLPKGSMAGVWLFGEDVETLVPHGVVGPAWQLQADKKASQIHSRGLFTDIDLAVMKATQDWIQIPDPGNRSVIILTDGVVDVSKDPVKSAESRKQLLRLTLPRLRALGAQIHTIALSANADTELMKTLATQSDGAYEQTNNATELQRLFLRLFEKSVKRDTLPIRGNKFTVDNSVEELTLLAFKKPDAAPTRLIAPDDTEYSRENPGKNSRWHSEDGYDIITVTEPTPGKWKLVADVDPDNRVMIVSNLKMKHDDLPNNVIAGESFELNVSLTEDGKPISKPEFIEKMSVAIQQISPDGETWNWQLADDGIGDDRAASDGIFTMAFGENLVAGKNQIKLEVDGKTFQRERNFMVEVHQSPFENIKTAQGIVDGNRTISIEVGDPLPWLRVKTIKIGARIKDPDGKVHFMKFRELKPGQWTLEILNANKPGNYEANLEMVGMTKLKRKLRVKLDPIIIIPEENKPPITDEAPKETKPEQATEEKPTEAAEETPSEEPVNEETNWIFVIGMVIGINALLFGVLGGGYFFYSRKNKTQTPDLLSDDEESTPEATDDDATKEESK